MVLEQNYIHDRIRIDSNGCWIWLLSVGSHGYGNAFIHGTSRVAHRVSYAAFVGELLPKMVIDHLCKVRRCVNPEHLEQVTQRTNIYRTDNAGILVAAKNNAKKTHCPSGHKYTDKSVYMYRGSRICRPCHKRHSRNYARKARGSNTNVV